MQISVWVLVRLGALQLKHLRCQLARVWGFHFCSVHLDAYCCLSHMNYAWQYQKQQLAPLPHLPTVLCGNNVDAEAVIMKRAKSKVSPRPQLQNLFLSNPFPSPSSTRSPHPLQLSPLATKKIMVTLSIFHKQPVRKSFSFAGCCCGCCCYCFLHINYACFGWCEGINTLFEF